MDNKYKINYKSKSFNYLSIDEETMLPYYEKIITKLADYDKDYHGKTKTSKNDFHKNIKKFNQYQKDISLYITNAGPDASKLYIKNLIGLNDIEANIIYQISIFTNKYFQDIDNHEIFKKTTEEQVGGAGKACTTLSLMLDMGGMVPGLGMAIDAFGVAVSLFCGDYFGAFLGMISIIPVAGWASGAIEIIRNMIKIYMLVSKNDDDDKDDDEDDEDEEDDDE